MAKSRPFVEPFTVAPVGEKGQITIPKSHRDRMRLDRGSKLYVLGLGNALVLVPADREFERISQRIQNTLKRAGVSQEELLEHLPQARRKVYRQIYGETTRGKGRR